MARNVDELSPQIVALEKIASYYVHGKGKTLLESLPQGDRPFFVGMGAIADAAAIAAMQCQRCAVAASSMEMAEVHSMPAALFSKFSPLLCLSRSGEDAKIPQFLRKVERGPLIAITNDEQSTLAQSANSVLPLFGGDETSLTNKAYLNSLALCWLVCRRLCHAWDGTEDEQLKRAISRVRVLQMGKASILKAWHDVMDGTRHLIFIGRGPQAISARRGAAVMAVMARTLVQAISLESMRNSFIELSEPGLGVVIFANSENTLQAELDLADELDGYGVNVLLVIDGMPRRIREDPPVPVGFDPFLSTLLDAISPQLWAIELSAALGGEGQKRRKKAEGNSNRPLD